MLSHNSYSGCDLMSSSPPMTASAQRARSSGTTALGVTAPSDIQAVVVTACGATGGELLDWDLRKDLKSTNRTMPLRSQGTEPIASKS